MTEASFESEGTPMVWMRHGDGVPGQLPAAAAAHWEAMGWVRCDAPPEVNPVLRDHAPPAQLDPESTSEQTSAQPKTTKGVKTDG